MRRRTLHPLFSCLLLAAAARCVCPGRLCAQTVTAPTYQVNVAVDEVSLTFHAEDAQGLAVTDLHVEDLHLLDNNRPPQKILDFQETHDLPLRAGLLVDTSVSMDTSHSGTLAILTRYARELLQAPADEAFVMDFGLLSSVVQPWTADGSLLVSGVRRMSSETGGRNGGTAIFDAVYRACQNQFGRPGLLSAGNFILLFSDGEDNASRASLQEAVDRCQRSNTAVYAFRAGGAASFSSGPKNLARLATESGGRVFYDDSDAGIAHDLRVIASDRRSQYRLVYKPAALKHDGAFHRIQLTLPERVAALTIRSGYYAPHAQMIE